MKKLRSLFLATMSAAKKESEDYAAIRGHVPKELYKQFKLFCLERGVDNSQGLEDLLRDYFALTECSQTSPASKEAK